MFGVYKTYEEFVAAAEEAAKRGELWFCPSCSNTNPVMKFCGAYGLKAHYVHCPACYQNIQHYTENANKRSAEIKKAVHTYITKNRRDIRYVGNHTRTPDDLYISAMECVQSPTGTCVYDAHYDCEKQTCLFCGLPDAR